MTVAYLLKHDKFGSNFVLIKQNLPNSIILPPKNGGFKARSHSVRKATCRCSDNVYTVVAAYSIQMYSKTKSLKRCHSCPESKFSQQTNFSIKISILGSISAKNEDKRSIKITQIGE